MDSIYEVQQSSARGAFYWDDPQPEMHAVPYVHRSLIYFSVVT
jgi:hypothetical protein